MSEEGIITDIRKANKSILDFVIFSNNQNGAVKLYIADRTHNWQQEGRYISGAATETR